MKIIVAGGTGFIGRGLTERLLEEQHEVTLLTRNPSGQPSAKNLKTVRWDGKTLESWMEEVEGADAVINLCGEAVAQRWTKAIKEKIVSSRIDTTRTLIAAIRAVRKKPSVLINASAVGFYGDVAEGEVDESRQAGNDYLARLCAQWESEAAKASSLGVRVVLPRLGIVLEKSGGALKRMIPAFRFFAGATPGSGNQWFPWVHRQDVLRAILFLLKNEKISGPVNVAAPETVTMRTFCKTLGRKLHRPCWGPIPSPLLKLIMGEGAGAVLSGQKVIPQKLQQASFSFAYPNLEGALEKILRG